MRDLLKLLIKSPQSGLIYKRHSSKRRIYNRIILLIQEPSRGNWIIFYFELIDYAVGEKHNPLILTRYESYIAILDKKIISFSIEDHYGSNLENENIDDLILIITDRRQSSAIRPPAERALKQNFNKIAKERSENDW